MRKNNRFLKVFAFLVLIGAAIFTTNNTYAYFYDRLKINAPASISINYSSINDINIYFDYYDYSVGTLDYICYNQSGSRRNYWCYGGDNWRSSIYFFDTMKNTSFPGLQILGGLDSNKGEIIDLKNDETIEYSAVNEKWIKYKLLGANEYILNHSSGMLIIFSNGKNGTNLYSKTPDIHINNNNNRAYIKDIYIKSKIISEQSKADSSLGFLSDIERRKLFSYMKIVLYDGTVIESSLQNPPYLIIEKLENGTLF